MNLFRNVGQLAVLARSPGNTRINTNKLRCSGQIERSFAPRSRISFRDKSQPESAASRAEVEVLALEWLDTLHGLEPILDSTHGPNALAMREHLGGGPRSVASKARVTL